MFRSLYSLSLYLYNEQLINNNKELRERARIIYSPRLSSGSCLYPKENGSGDCGRSLRA